MYNFDIKFIIINIPIFKSSIYSKSHRKKDENQYNDLIELNKNYRININSRQSLYQGIYVY
jgi:hypothetical protein